MGAGHGQTVHQSVRAVSHKFLNYNRESCSLSAVTIHGFHLTIYNVRFRNEGPWRLWQRFQGARGLSSYTKRITLAESDDGGQTWHSQRPATFLLEEMHGGGVQLPDGRVVFLYTHRGPTYRGGERAKVSYDEGRTWRDELYFMTATPSVSGVLRQLRFTTPSGRRQTGDDPDTCR